MAQRFNSALWECRIVANTSAFQAEDAGSIPVIPSTFAHRSGGRFFVLPTPDPLTRAGNAWFKAGTCGDVYGGAHDFIQ